MVSLLILVAGQVFTLFLLMAVGFFFTKREIFTADTRSRMSTLLLYVVTPCVVIHSLTQTECTPELTRSVVLTLGASVAFYVVFALLTAPLFRKQAADTRDPLRFGSLYGNVGFMGLPLIQGVLGTEALIYCTVGVAIFNIGTWTHGLILMGGKSNASLKKAILNPGVIGCIIGFVLFFTGLRLPSPIAAGVQHLGNMNTPLAMLVIGGQMASVKLLETFRRPLLYRVSAIKLLVLPLLTAFLILPFGLNASAYSTVVILAGCPIAGITGIFAQSFRRDAATTAQSITLSTLLSILTLPVVTLYAHAVYLWLG